MDPEESSRTKAGETVNAGNTRETRNRDKNRPR
jgi:hypothetical protein